jgi:enterobactin synthetase component F
MNRLPLVAAQPGIWMAEQLSTLPNAWSVAHYTELKGDIDAPLLAKAIAEGMMQADTLRMRFAEDNGEVWQWVDDTFILPEPSIVRVDSHAAAVALMEADLNQNLRVDSGQPLAFHQLIQVGERHWYWYQRYHHLVVDGFSFPAITRQIAAIYAAWKKGEPTPESPFTPLPRWWTSISAIATARRISATAPSGQSSASSFLLRSRSLPRRCRGAPPRPIFCA